MTRDFIDTIDRTPAYHMFMQQLEKHHQVLGTSLQREPVLGSRKLDMFKIYRLVIEAGGCEKVSQERGWRKIAQAFELPSTCTNSAYVFKAIYYKYLRSFEEVDLWKRTPTLLTRGVLSPRQTGQSMAMPPQVPPMVARMQAQIYTDPIPIVPRPQPLPDNLTLRQLIGQGSQSRLLLAMRSRLPNEIDWAFNTLIRLSHHEALDISNIPELLDTMLNLVPQLIPSQHNVAGIVQKDVIILEETERILQVLHIIRNLSFLGANKSVLAFNSRCKELLRAGIALPPTVSNVEIRQYCLDTVENISTRMILRSSQDALYLLLQEELFGADRQGILTAIRALTRLAMNEQNLRALADINERILRRVWELVLVPDEELVATMLDYLYQYTSVFEDLALRLPRAMEGSAVRRLVQLLTWMPPAEQRAALIREQQKRTADQPASSQHATATSTNAATVATSATTNTATATSTAQLDMTKLVPNWLRKAYITDAAATIGLAEIYFEYQSAFKAIGPLLSATEFATTEELAQAATEAPTEDTDVPMTDVSSLCQWHDCTESITDADLLTQHVHTTHVQTQPNSNKNGEEGEQQLAPSASVTCHWLTCTRSFSPPNAHRKLMAHTAIHTAQVDTTNGGSSSGSHQRTDTNDKETGATSTVKPANPPVVVEPELVGVPLTASLILRNLARHSENHVYFAPWEIRLVELMMQPSLSRHVSAIFNEIYLPQPDDPMVTTITASMNAVLNNPAYS
ncbi:hypothetical protein BDF19DRAFT_453695 [Syncephalis fuscata]|nr:hypothetical protein BDF19DRAFT_453695 [Syncephalis fuscata]